MTTYVVVDIEADGPVPGLHSMISLGAVAVSLADGVLTDFEVNLAPLDGATAHPDTLAWFQREAPEAWDYVNRNQVAPGAAMTRFADWARTLPEPRLLVACPSPFDFMWIDWYLYRFLGDQLRPPALYPLFRGCALDLVTLYADRHNVPFHRMGPRRIPEDWLGGHAHTHKALDDARGYAQVLLRLAGSGTLA